MLATVHQTMPPHSRYRLIPYQTMPAAEWQHQLADSCCRGCTPGGHGERMLLDVGVPAAARPGGPKTGYGFVSKEISPSESPSAVQTTTLPFNASQRRGWCAPATSPYVEYFLLVGSL